MYRAVRSLFIAIRKQNGTLSSGQLNAFRKDQPLGSVGLVVRRRVDCFWLNPGLKPPLLLAGYIVQTPYHGDRVLLVRAEMSISPDNSHIGKWSRL